MDLSWPGTMLDTSCGFIVGDVLDLVRRRVRAPRVIIPKVDSFCDVSLGDFHCVEKPYVDCVRLWHGCPNYHRWSGILPEPVYLDCESRELLLCALFCGRLVVNFEDGVYPNINTYSHVLCCWKGMHNHVIFENSKDENNRILAYKNIAKCGGALLVETRDNSAGIKSFSLFDMVSTKFIAETPFKPFTNIGGIAGGQTAFVIDGPLKRVDRRTSELLVPVSSCGPEFHLPAYEMTIVDENILAVKSQMDVTLYDVRNGCRLTAIENTNGNVMCGIFVTE